MDNSNQYLLRCVHYKEILHDISQCIMKCRFQKTDVMREILLYFNIDLPVNIVIMYVVTVLDTKFETRPPKNLKELSETCSSIYIKNIDVNSLDSIIKIYPCIIRFIRFCKNAKDNSYTLYQLLKDIDIHPVITIDNFYLLVGSILRSSIAYYELIVQSKTDYRLRFDQNRYEKFVKLFRDVYGNEYDNILTQITSEIPFMNPFCRDYQN